MIPFATTTISVLRRTVADADADGYPDVEASYLPVPGSTGVRAAISSGLHGVKGGGVTERAGSEESISLFKLDCDPVDIGHTDRVLDETTQVVYRIEWVSQRKAFGLDHTAAGMSTLVGYI